MKPPVRSNRIVRSTFFLPAVIALASSIGLVAALVGDGWMDGISWLGLAAPLLAVGWAISRRR